MTIATMTPGDCGSAEHDAEAIAAIRREEARAAADADRRRVPLPRIPRPGDLQRRRVAAAGHRGPAAGPARHHPDRAAGRLHLRPRDDQPAGPRCLLRRAAAQLRHPAVGAGRRRSAKIPHLYFVDPLEGVDRDGRPVPADFHVDVSRVFATKRADARLPRQPAQLAAAAARHRRVPRRARRSGAPAAGPRSASRRPRRSASTAGTPIRRTTCCSNCSGRTARGKPASDGSGRR